MIEVREPSKKPEDNAEALLLGHSHNVCSLDVDPAGRFIVSGSWDAEARIWPVGKWECETVLRGHEGKFASKSLETQCYSVARHKL